MIDAVPADGGIVTIPAGTFVGPRLIVRDGVILQGQGWNTVIPPFVESSEPRFRISLRDLAVDWTNITVDVPPVQYGIDWRFISNGSITNVKVSGGTHGLLVDFAAQSNVFTGLVAQATQVAVELYGVDSSSPIGNVFVGGRFSAPTCLTLAGDSQANNLTVSFSRDRIGKRSSDGARSATTSSSSVMCCCPTERWSRRRPEHMCTNT
jgi:hypothetical protein